MNRVPLFLLYLNVLIVATCGLIYELLAGTLASYLLGDSVTQFSLVIGVYLSAMGVGAWLSKYITRQLAASFIEVELAIALLGGASTTLLFLSFGTIDWFRLLLFGLVFFIGVLAGLELPLLMRILKDHVDFDDLVSRVLTFDYIGALVASLLFPTLLVPHLGLIRTSLVFGILNACVALWGTFILSPLINSRRTVGLRIRSILTIALLSVGVLKAESLTTYAEEQQLSARIIHAESSAYQRILLTQNNTGFQLFLNGHLQFNSADEYRYHEALVHPAMSAAKAPRKILVLGGGDGLAVREILKYPAVEQVTLVDLDPAMTSLASRFPPLRELSQGALEDPRVQIFNEDAFLWVSKDQEKFDVVIIDFPDPTNFSVGKLYTSFFYRHLQKQMTDDTMLAIQCTSPLVAPRSYWCIINTLEAVGFDVEAYQAAVPTFGVWGFALASLKNEHREPLEHQLAENLLSPLRFLNPQLLTQLFSLPSDISRLPTEVNRLDNQALIHYYEQEWRRWE